MTERLQNDTEMADVKRIKIEESETHVTGKLKLRVVKQGRMSVPLSDTIRQLVTDDEIPSREEYKSKRHGTSKDRTL